MGTASRPPTSVLTRGRSAGPPGLNAGCGRVEEENAEMLRVALHDRGAAHLTFTKGKKAGGPEWRGSALLLAVEGIT